MHRTWSTRTTRRRSTGAWSGSWTGSEGRRAAGSTITGGGVHTCGLTDSGAAYCWGDNQYGQLGIGTTGGSFATPQPVAGGLSFVGIDGGVSHTCAWTDTGQAYCWGENAFGEIGDGTDTQRSVPVAVEQ